MVRSETLDEKTLRPWGHGMQKLVSALADVFGLKDDASIEICGRPGRDPS